jgi:UDPglucose 6-dehydrogenase
VRTAKEAGEPLSIVEAVEHSNTDQKWRFFDKVEKALGGSVRGRRIALWGLAFKPQTDDMREAPSLTLIDRLLEGGATVVAHDPEAMKEAKRRLGDRVAYAKSSYEALSGADALVVMTDWNEYRHPDLARIKRELKQPIVIDGRNLYDPAQMRGLGLQYTSIGRPAA